VHVGVGAQYVRQHHGVQVVGLLASDGVAFPVSGRGQRIDRVDRSSSGTQAGDQQSAGGRDGHGYRILGAVAVFGEDIQ
jgi:hypothetical protein